MSDENPSEKDVKDFKFQQLCKVRVSNSPSTLPIDRVALIATSSKYGLTFVGVQKGFKVLRTADFLSQDQQHAADRLLHIITDFPEVAHVDVGADVTHLSLSCDDLTLAVVTYQSGGQVFIDMYDVRTFAGQVSLPVSPFMKVNSGSGNTALLDIAWNPVLPTLVVTCQSSGRLDMYDITDKLGIKASAASARARCVCWSPKGKQLVAGRDDGTLVQYDPDLNQKRLWDYPTALPDQSFEARVRYKAKQDQSSR